MQGKQTHPEIVEKVREIAARENNITEAARQVGIPMTTAYGLVTSSDNFEEFRTQVQREYIIKTWNNILKIEDILVKKIESYSKKKEINSTSLREFTGALKDLKQSVENVLAEVTLRDGDKSITLSWKKDA